MVEEGSLANDRSALARLTAGYRGALAVMEAAAHSPWVSRYLKELGFEVIVETASGEVASVITTHSVEDMTARKFLHEGLFGLPLRLSD